MPSPSHPVRRVARILAFTGSLLTLLALGASEVAQAEVVAPGLSDEPVVAVTTMAKLTVRAEEKPEPPPVLRRKKPRIDFGRFEGY